MKYCPSCTKLVNFTKNGEDVFCDDCKAIIPSLVKPVNTVNTVNAQAPLTPEQSDIHTAHIAAEVANTSIRPDVILAYKNKFPQLLLRVRDGNEKLTTAWKQIQDFDDLTTYDAGLDKILAAQGKLQRLCLELEVIEEGLQGEGECLYFMDGKKQRPCTQKELTPKGKEVECICWACPSARHWWSEEKLSLWPQGIM